MNEYNTYDSGGVDYGSLVHEALSRQVREGATKLELLAKEMGEIARRNPDVLLDSEEVPENSLADYRSYCSVRATLNLAGWFGDARGESVFLGIQERPGWYEEPEAFVDARDEFEDANPGYIDELEESFGADQAYEEPQDQTAYEVRRVFPETLFDLDKTL